MHIMSTTGMMPLLPRSGGIGVAPEDLRGLGEPFRVLACGTVVASGTPAEVAASRNSASAPYLAAALAEAATLTSGA